MAAFIKQHLLENRITKDISQIIEFRFVIQEFLSTIYEFSWNKLTVNNKNISFRQYVSSQSNKKPTNNIPTSKPTKGKQANISRISPLIPSRPNESILDKFKYYKMNQLSNLASKSNN